jgi:predicted amidophosphoribosyltransferase
MLGLPLRSYLLVRSRPRPDKLRLSRKERWRTVRGAYGTRESAQVDNLRVLLVDDVFTTGATLDACARALKRAGAAHVVGLTFARAVPDWIPQHPPEATGRVVAPRGGSI